MKNIHISMKRLKWFISLPLSNSLLIKLHINMPFYKNVAINLSVIRTMQAMTSQAISRIALNSYYLF